MPLLDELITRLVTQSVGTFGTDIFAGSGAVIPTGNGPYLSLTETGGSAPSGTQNDTAVENPTVQIAARAKSSVDARAKLKLAYTALGGANGLHNITLSGTFYLKIKPRQGITDIGKDDPGRPMCAFNIDAEKQPS